MSYYKQLKDPRWQRRRLEIMQRDQFACFFCYDTTSPLNVHHIRYDKAAEGAWDYESHDLITVCESCHRWYHSTKANDLWRIELMIARIFYFQNVVDGMQAEREVSLNHNKQKGETNMPETPTQPAPDPEPEPEPPPPDGK